MSRHFSVSAIYSNGVEKRDYFVTDRPMARRSALQDGARVIYKVSEIKRGVLTEQYIGRDYAMQLLQSIVFQIEAGVPASDAVKTAIISEEDPSKRARLQGAVDALNRGAAISDAIYATGLYDTTVKSILSAGERIGGDNAIVSALEYMEDRKASWSAYSAILLALFMELSTALTVPPTIQEYAIPYLQKNVPKASPEAIASYLAQVNSISFNNLIWMWFSVAMTVFISGMAIAWLFSPRARDWLMEKVLVKTPMIGEWYANDALARSYKVFATMIKAGVKMNDAILTILKTTNNPVSKKFWKKVSDELSIGSTPGVAFTSTNFLRQDEVMVVKLARGNAQLAHVFSRMAIERERRQKVLSSRVFKVSIYLTVGYIVVTLLIGFRLFGLFNSGLDMSVNSISQGY